MCHEFIKLIENTNMTKVYKMPVLQAIYNDSDIRMEVTNEEIVDCWKAFLMLMKTGEILILT